jgi:tetratricopeptide (TPR) repeat protein
VRRSLEQAALPRLLVLCTRRPQYEPPWTGAANVAELRLTPLSDGSTIDLLKTRLGVDEVPKALAGLIAEKAEGNPLFVEELLSFLQDQGRVHAGEHGIAFEQGDSGVPANLANLLMDRVDRLDDGARVLLEAAAVIGRRFAPGLMGRVAGLDGETARHLHTLEDAELIFPTDAGEVYEFKHALIRDAVYDSLLEARRTELHEKAATAIEHTHANRLGEAADVLAHHYSHTERAEKAVRYLALAGEKSLGVYSLEDAEARFRAVLKLLEQHPDAANDAFLADVLLGLARVMYFNIEFNAIMELVETYLPRVEALGDKRRLSRFLFESGYAHVFASKVKEGRKLLGRARALGEEIGDDLSVAYADLGLMWDRLFWGEPGEERGRAQREAGERIVEVGLRRGDIWLASKAGLALGLDLQAWGHLGESRAELMKLMAMSRETNDPRPRSMALWALAALDSFSGNYTEAIENADEALRICLSAVDRSAALAYKTAAMILSGKAAEGVALAEPALHEVEAKGLTMTVAPLKMVLGVGRVMLGDMARGMRAIEDATAAAEQLGQTIARPYGDLFQGETYLQMAIGGEKPPLSVMLRNLPFLLRTLPFATRKSRRCLESALDGFRTLESPSFIARCLYDLGLLDRAGKRTAEARANFVEARGIADSVEATTLVDQIDATLPSLS